MPGACRQCWYGGVNLRSVVGGVYPVGVGDDVADAACCAERVGLPFPASDPMPMWDMSTGVRGNLAPAADSNISRACGGNRP